MAILGNILNITVYKYGIKNSKKEINMKRILAFLLAFSPVFALLSCDSGDSTVHVSGVLLNKSLLNMEVGDTDKLTATINPSNAGDKTVSWVSGDTSVVTVSAYGEVKALKAGSANITVTTKDGSKTAQCIVNVVDNRSPAPSKCSVVFDYLYDNVKYTAIFFKSIENEYCYNFYTKGITGTFLLGSGDTQAGISGERVPATSTAIKTISTYSNEVNRVFLIKKAGSSVNYWSGVSNFGVSAEAMGKKMSDITFSSPDFTDADRDKMCNK
jgi:hypothetical protein